MALSGYQLHISDASTKSTKVITSTILTSFLPLQHWGLNPNFCECKAATSLLGYAPSPASTVAHVSSAPTKVVTLFHGAKVEQWVADRNVAIHTKKCYVAIRNRYSQFSIPAGFIPMGSTSQSHVWTENIPNVLSMLKVPTTGQLRQEDHLRSKDFNWYK